MFYELFYDMEEVLYNTTVVFDERKVSIAGIVDRLKSFGYPIRGKPEMLP